MPVDILLVALLVLGFVAGFFRGVVRALLAVGAWGVSFIVASYLRVPIGSWLAQSSSFSPFYAYMLAFVLIFIGIFGSLLLVILLSRTPTEFARHPLLDDVLGGAVGVVVMALTIGGVMVMLGSYYTVDNPPPVADVGWAAEVFRALGASGLAGTIGDTLVQGANFFLGPLLPPEVRAVMA